MDILYPCSLCSKTFESRKQFLIHTTTIHASNVSSTDIYNLKNSVNCAHCCKKFSSKCLLKKHMRLKHYNFTQYLNNKSTLRSKENRISLGLSDNALLKVSTYNYKFQIFLVNYKY